MLNSVQLTMPSMVNSERVLDLLTMPSTMLNSEHVLDQFTIPSMLKSEYVLDSVYNAIYAEH
jgi:hypothetical protein